MPRKKKIEKNIDLDLNEESKFNLEESNLFNEDLILNEKIKKRKRKSKKEEESKELIDTESDVNKINEPFLKKESNSLIIKKKLNKKKKEKVKNLDLNRDNLDKKLKVNKIILIVNNLIESKFKYNFKFLFNNNLIIEYKTKLSILGEVKEEFNSFIKDNSIKLINRKIEIIFIDHRVLYLNIHLPSKAKNKHKDVIDNNLIDLLDKDYKKNAKIKTNIISFKEENNLSNTSLFNKKENIYIGNIFVSPLTIYEEINRLRKYLFLKSIKLIDINNYVTSLIDKNKELDKAIFIKEEDEFIIVNYYFKKNLINSYIINKSNDYLDKLRLNILTELVRIKKDYRCDFNNIYLCVFNINLLEFIKNNFLDLNILGALS